MDYKGQKISGFTQINHEVRIKLELTNDEYVLLDFLNSAWTENRDITYELLYRKIGMTKEQYDLHSKVLTAKKWIRPVIKDEQKYAGRIFIQVSKRWREGFYSMESEFDEFWLKDGKPAWPGSKADAKAKYILARKKYPADYLLKQRNWYFRFLELPDNSFRQKMGCSVFLNMTTKRFEEDFEGHVREYTNKERIQQPIEKINKEAKDKLFQ